MTDPIDDQPQQTPDPEPIPTQSKQTSPPPLLPEDQLAKILALKEKATQAFKSKTSEAREAFDKQFPGARDDLEKGLNHLTYALGYAISFGSTLAKEFSPENVTESFEKGSHAGEKAAEEFIQRRQATPKDENDPVAS
jgi:hypothetical protein